MGLGTTRGPWEDYEWFDPQAPTPAQRRSRAKATHATQATGPRVALDHDGIWLPGPAVRVLLVDLDNLRVESSRLRTRVELAVTLARQADVAVFAGQHASVRRARPALQEYGESALSVGDEPNEADLALLEVAEQATGEELQFVVMSNDGIFARLASRGPLVVISPGAGALSDRLAEAAARIIDLQQVEPVAG